MIEINDPFSALSLSYEKAGLMESQPSDNKVIKIPSDMIDLLEVEEPVEIFTPLDVRYIGRDEVNMGTIEVPADTLNLSRIDGDVLDFKGRESSILSLAIQSYASLLTANPSLSREQICFSKITQQLIVLPSLKSF